MEPATGHFLREIRADEELWDSIRSSLERNILSTLASAKTPDEAYAVKVKLDILATFFTEIEEQITIEGVNDARTYESIP